MRIVYTSSDSFRSFSVLSSFWNVSFMLYFPFSSMFLSHCLLLFMKNKKKNISNVGVVLYILVILAAVIPNLGSIISLVGAVSSSALALIAPPIIEIITYYNVGYGRYNWMLWKDFLILIFGLCGFVFGTWASVAQIINPSID